MLSGELIGVRGLSGEIQREVIAGGGGSGTSDYPELNDLPQINGVELIGNKTSEELGLASAEALKNKLDKVTPEFDEGATRGYVYFINTSKEQTVKKVQIQANADTIPLRNPNGNFYVQNPTFDYECTNKRYVDNKFNGSNKAVSFVNYSAMITSINALSKTGYSVGQNIMIITLDVPDLWVSEIAEESVAYTYVSDDDFVADLNTNGSVQVGYFKLSALETQKVDLTDYVKNTDYATTDKAGILVVGSGLTISSSSHKLNIQMASNEGIKNKSSSYTPIVPKNLDFAIVQALTNNSITLTEEQKTAIKNWLGL